MAAIAATGAAAGKREREQAAAPRPLKSLLDFEPFRAAGRGFDPSIAASALALNLLGLALPLAILQIYDKMNAAQALETLSFLGVGLVTVALLEFALRLAQSYSLAIDAQRLGYRITTDAVERQLMRGARRKRRESATVTIEKFRSLDAIANYASGDQRRDLIDLPFSGVFLLAIFLIGGSLVLVPIGVIGVAVIVAYVLLRRSRALAAQRETGARRRADFLGEFFGGFLTVKGLGSEPLMLRRFERLTAGSARVFRDSLQAAGDMQIAVGAFSAIGVVAMVGVGAFYVFSQDLTPGGLAACSLLSSRAIQPLVRSVGAVAERQKALVAAENARSLFNSDKPSPTDFTAEKGEPGPIAIAAEGVSLTLEDRPVLDEASFALPAGAAALLEAPSMEEARLFFRLLAGLEPAEEGRLTLNGAPAEDLRRTPGRVVIVAPHTRLFRGTIMENLTLFGAMADTHDALRATRLLGVDDVIGALPAGYDTMVNQGTGDSLSQAHLRAIVLARAIAQRPGLLLLDQPHLYLDAALEQRMGEALRALRAETTMIIRSDRPQAAAAADHRMVLRDGWFCCEASPAAAPGAETQAGEGAA